jgi:reductive dehalogenase
VADRNGRSVAAVPEGLLRPRRHDRYPSYKLKRVDHPTTHITPDIARIDQRTEGFLRAERGELGPVVQRENARFVQKYPLSAALEAVEQALPLQGSVVGERAPLPEDPVIMSRHIKEVANFLRADVVGICRLPAYAVYSHNYAGEPIVNNHKYAIAILIDQDYDSFAGASGNDWLSNSQSYVAYTNAGLIACTMADYIRRLGYPARAHHTEYYEVIVPPILLLAGLGEVCRLGGLVLNPFLGPRFKAAVVTTDLPLEPDRPIDFGLRDFCAVCKKCARECPSGALSDGDMGMYNGYERYDYDVDACTRYRITNSRGASCGRCIKVCPWNKPNTWYHTLAVQLAQRSSLARRGLVWLDDVLGYGGPDLRHKWWFDLENVNGRLVAR